MEALNNLIVIKQLPVIEEHLKTISAEAQKKIDLALSMPCTEETKKDVKKLRASLNSEFKELESARKGVENEINEHLRPFRDTYKIYITDLFADADKKLKGKIDEVEQAEKKEKEQNLREYFAELVSVNRCEFIDFESVIPKVDLSKSETFYKKQIDTKVEQIVKDLDVIDNHEDSAELMVEYVKTFDLAEALITVTTRHTEMEQFAKTQAENTETKEQEQKIIKEVDEAFGPPAVVQAEEDDKVIDLIMKIRHKKSKCKELKEYLIKEGFEIL